MKGSENAKNSRNSRNGNQKVEVGQAGGGGRGQAGGDGRRAGKEVGGMGQAVRSLAEGGQAAGWWSAERCWELVGRSGKGPISQ